MISDSENSEDFENRQIGHIGNADGGLREFPPV